MQERHTGERVLQVVGITDNRTEGAADERALPTMYDNMAHHEAR